ncbi:uncharacterized protein LY89DRAFT_690438 [Mollisia scopiformis]|uniref:Uncharacterized protein n=1 Tax=Mollisia scopiformis TaxID=149040 RepID=A0A132BCP3_MOLSC|nr:uncharacterized protein LY89DRAFT_690438 [Mollisia scopiformis]KUJ09427.1 hypothetical protein LY89DRAFT_690438 [Mollisia scopiformis]
MQSRLATNRPGHSNPSLESLPFPIILPMHFASNTMSSCSPSLNLHPLPPTPPDLQGTPQRLQGLSPFPSLPSKHAHPEDSLSRTDHPVPVPDLIIPRSRNATLQFL